MQRFEETQFGHACNILYIYCIYQWLLYNIVYTNGYYIPNGYYIILYIPMVLNRGGASPQGARALTRTATWKV